MTRFERMKEILDAAIEGQEIGAHGAFWRPLSLEDFKRKRVYSRQVVRPGDGANSNLVLALRGQAPFGEDIGTEGAELPRMPVGFPPVPDEDILFIERWIDDGCPDDPFEPAAGSAS